MFTKFEHQFQYQGAGRDVGAVYMLTPLAGSTRADELREICSLTVVDAHILAHSSILHMSEKNLILRWEDKLLFSGTNHFFTSRICYAIFHLCVKGDVSKYVYRYKIAFIHGMAEEKTFSQLGK